MEETWHSFSRFGQQKLPGLIVPVLILIVGWLVAFAAAWLVRKGLERTKLDDRIAARLLGEQRAKELNIPRMMGRGTYWLVLLFTLLAVLQSLQLTAATEPFQELLGSIFAYIPRVIGAALILLVAWIIAVGVRKGTYVLLRRWEVDRRLSAEGPEPGEGVSPSVEAPGERPTIPEKNGEPAPVARAIGETAYWLVFLLFLPAVLGALRLEGLLAPVEEMTQEVLGFLPNLASAAIVFVVGWFVAKIVMRLTTNVLAGLGLDRLSARVGLDKTLGDRPLSRFIGIVVQVLILVPVAIAALQALQLEAITEPASAMLETFFTALPLVFAAALVIGIAYVVGRLVRGLVRGLLSSVGFDDVLPRLGISTKVVGKRTPSDAVGIVAMVAVIYFAAMEAADLLAFEGLAELMADVAVLGGRVLLGLAVFGVGLWLANLAANAVRRSELKQSDALSIVTRVAVLALAGAMALRQMGLANEIIELAFGLAFGAVAVAAAIAFGLGGRDSAARAIEDWRKRYRERETGVHSKGPEAAE